MKDKYQKVITLVVGNTSWWKNKKHRKESADILKKIKKNGWKIKKKENIEKNANEINSNCYRKYMLIKIN